MAVRTGLLLLLFTVALTACSGASASDPLEMRVNTPTPTPIPPTPTPVPEEPIELILSTTQVYQAGTVLISVTGDVRAGTIHFLGREHPLTRGDHSMYSFVGIDVDDPPGSHQARVEFETHNGSRGTLEATIEVLNTEWDVDYLYFEPGEADDLLVPGVAQEEAALLADIYDRYTAEKLWDAQWLVPTEGGITARFGSQRSINDGPPGGHHSGTDIGAPEGTPVIATNSGFVIMSRYLDVRGYMVIIDHGGGLLSGYAHLSEINVSEGQQIAAGDLVGGVGNTGLSTGPHLHWEMSVHGVLVDPWRFVDGSNGF